MTVNCVAHILPSYIEDIHAVHTPQGDGALLKMEKLNGIANTAEGEGAASFQRTSMECKCDFPFFF